MDLMYIKEIVWDATPPAMVKVVGIWSWCIIRDINLTLDEIINVIKCGRLQLRNLIFKKKPIKKKNVMILYRRLVALIARIFKKF